MRTHWFLQNGSFTLYASKWQTQLKRSYNNPIFCLCTMGPAPVSHVVPSPGRPVGTDGRAWLTPLFLCSTTTACVCQALCFLFSPVSARPSHGKCVVLTTLTQWRRFIVAYLHLNEWSLVRSNTIRVSEVVVIVGPRMYFPTYLVPFIWIAVGSYITSLLSH